MKTIKNLTDEEFQTIRFAVNDAAMTLRGDIAVREGAIKFQPSESRGPLQREIEKFKEHLAHLEKVLAKIDAA